MSICYYLYNAPQGHQGMHADGDQSQQIDTANQLKSRLMQLFPQINGWGKHDNFDIHPSYNYPVTYSSLTKDNCSQEKEYLDISLMEHGDGYIHIIAVNKGSPKLIRKFVEEFQLTFVWEMQSCQLVDPYEYINNWEKI